MVYRALRAPQPAFGARGVRGAESFRLTVGRAEDGRLLAIISSGGHPQISGSGQCTVLGVEVVKSMKDAKRWFRQARVERPWETRQ